MTFNILVKLNGIENYLPIQTSNNGNCLYNAISIVLFGTEDFFYLIKIGILAILFKNEAHFRYILEKTSSPRGNFENFVEVVSTPQSWGDEICMIAISILINRPLNVYSIDPVNNIPYSHEYCIIQESYSNSPINIAFILNHFIALLPEKNSCLSPKPQFNQFIARYSLSKLSLSF